MRGLIFDIEEGSIHDGPGLRVTVFFKGCPLRCRWCHSPEGWIAAPERLLLPQGERISGRWYDAEELSSYLQDLLSLLGPDGGVTFSGGDPLMQGNFLLEVLKALKGFHTILETCGHGETATLLALSEKVSLIHYGLKLMDEKEDLFWTGQSSLLALRNLRALDDHEKAAPYRIRLPLLKGIMDTESNLKAMMALCRTLKRLQGIDFLPANALAEAKYTLCGKEMDKLCRSLETGSIPAWFAPEVPWQMLR